MSSSSFPPTENHHSCSISRLGVSSCFVFKSRLQEYVQRFNLPTPTYEIVTDGPPHEPLFRSTVTVDNISYESLPGFYNRKAAEQSAAEVALAALLQSGIADGQAPHPVQETGLCKNLLQEYAQKMRYAIPVYNCRTETTRNGVFYICTVEAGGIYYIGGAARTKKEAEIKAARTALLAIQSRAAEPGVVRSGVNLTVLPVRKLVQPPIKPLEKPVLEPKRKIKKKSSKKKSKWLKRRKEIEQQRRNCVAAAAAAVKSENLGLLGAAPGMLGSAAALSMPVTEPGLLGPMPAVLGFGSQIPYHQGTAGIMTMFTDPVPEVALSFASPILISERKPTSVPAPPESAPSTSNPSHLVNNGCLTLHSQLLS